MFDWKRSLTSRGVPFHTSGRHELVVHCPFCGEADQSQHLSISTRGRGWRCLRNPTQHHGSQYTHLLAKLFNCTAEYARALLGEEAVALPDEDTFSESWRRQLGIDTVSTKPKFLKLPESARPLATRTGPIAKKFWKYLGDRGYTLEQSRWIADVYNLHYAVSGHWAYRMIIPIYDTRDVLMTWTGRSILPHEKVRYKTLSGEHALAPPSNLLLGLPMLNSVYNPRCLVVTEGPFDAIAISALGHRAGVYGTCLFGVQVSEAQSLLLDQFAERFSRIRLLVDPDARMRVLGLRDRLPKSCVVTDLLEGVKDPAELVLTPAGCSWIQSLVV